MGHPSSFEVFVRYQFVAVIVCLSLFSGASLAAQTVDGPLTRKITNPKAVLSEVGTTQVPLPVEALLTIVRINGVAHSRNGEKLVYVSNASGRPNLWVMNVDGTSATQIVQSNDRQGGALFTADSRDVVYSQDRGGDECFDIWVVPSSGGPARNLTHTDNVSEASEAFSPDGTMLAIGVKQKDEAQTNLAVMSWPGGTTRQLTHEADAKAGWQMGVWSPDGRSLYAVRRIGLDDSDVYKIDVVNGSAVKLFEHTGRQQLSVDDVSADGSKLLITSNAKAGYDNVALFELASRTMQWITDSQWSASGVAFSPDGADVVYTSNVNGRISTRFYSLATKKVSEKNLPAGMNLPSVSPTPFLPDGSLLLLHEDSSRPQELFRLLPTNTLQQITHNANHFIAETHLPKSQLVTYRSFDGRLISAFVWVPPNIKRNGKAPAVVAPHGGPSSQTTDTFNGRNQLLASRGFVVISPNYRGSTGYGMEFQRSNIKDLGGADLKDVMAGVDFLKATGFIDPERVGMWSGSYGGFLTLMAIGKYPNRFAAAVDEFGILNWLTLLENEDPELQEHEKGLLGDPVADRAVYEQSSPLQYIRNERAPLLVMQGENDIRVPKEEAEQVVQILQSQGRTVDAVFYPEEGHGFVKREHQRDELTRAVTWLEKYLKPSH